MVKYLFLILAINVVFHQKITVIFAEDSCYSHLDCVSLSSDGHGYCCRDYSAHSSRTCRMNVSSCLDRFCTSHYECDSPEECCWSNKCTKCTFCLDDSDCGTEQYCCKTAGGCRNSSCMGESCRYHNDCGGKGECCQLNKCVKCPYALCKYHNDCSFGQYCCGRESSDYSKGICNESCVGDYCISNEDCGLPDECCYSDVCIKSGCYCSSNHHCSNGQYCCDGTLHGQCNYSCVGKPCTSDYDCGGITLREWCRRGKCAKDECDVHFDCYQPEHSCCKKTFSNEFSECKTQCINESCSSDSDCARSRECCGSNNKCTSYCEKSFPIWLILLIVIGSLVFLSFGVVASGIKYCRKKPIVHQGTHQPPPQGGVEMVPVENQNDTREHNNVVPNIPPPPYSINDETFLPECEQDLPPNYLLI